MKSIFIGLALFICLFFILEEIISYVQRKRSPGYKKLKSFQKEIKKDEHILDRLANIIMPLIKLIPKKGKIETFILRAGSPYNLNFNRYVVIKILMTVALYYLLNPGSTFMKIVVLAAGLFGLDLILLSKKKARQLEILKELPFMMNKIARSTSNGVPMREVLTVLSTRLQGPLQAEVKRLSAHYNIDGNLSRCLPLFADRIGMEEVDNMSMAMIQAEQSGRVRAILEKQAEILKRRESFKAFKSTKNRSNFLPLATVGMVVCIFLLVAVPMGLMIMTNGMFK